VDSNGLRAYVPWVDRVPRPRSESHLSILRLFGSRLVGPFVTASCVVRSIKPELSAILDVGCGPGHFFQEVRRRIAPRYAVGVDLFLPFLSACRRGKVFDDLILCDVRALPFRRRSFDSVLCTEVIEHLEKGDGIKLIHQLEDIAEHNVIISTPVGFLRECPEYDRERTLQGSPEYRIQQNAYRSPHASGWSPDEFRMKGYHVVGTSGHRLQRLRRDSTALELLIALSYPVVHFIPEIAFQMVAQKHTRNDA
jgi:SAM-dependent methyltransferase